MNLISGLVVIVAFGAVAAVLFILLRAAVLWYFQIHRIVALLEKMARVNADTKTSEIGKVE